MKPKLSWKARIIKARKRGFTDEDRNDSCQWRYCAVGERLGIKREPNNYDISERIGDEAVNLGLSFTNAVSYYSVEDVERIYNKIQKLPKQVKEDVM